MKTMLPKTVRTVQMVILAAGALTAFGGAAADSVPATVTGIILIVLSILFHVVFYRCPHCAVYLGRTHGEYCPYCGKKVNEKKQENQKGT